MITDDPGTPGDKKWEINLVWTTERVDGSTSMGLPLLDANYGIGDRTELTYEAPWANVSDEKGSRYGMGNSLFGLKYRFYDSGEKDWQASVYPQYTFLTPGTHSDRRGLADSGSTLLVPVEVAKDFETYVVNFDAGHVFSSKSGGDQWMAGALVGKELKKGWEVDLELHATTSNQLDHAEWILNAGTRIDLSESATLMIAVGRDLSNGLDEKVSLMTYLGIQLRL